MLKVNQTSWFMQICSMSYFHQACQQILMSLYLLWSGSDCVFQLLLPAVPIGPGKCRLLNRNAFRFTKGGLGARVARAVMKVAPGWAVHMGTQVWAAFSVTAHAAGCGTSINWPHNFAELAC